MLFGEFLAHRRVLVSLLESRDAFPSKPIPVLPVGFVNTRCPRCQRVTSYLSLQVTPLVTCTWSNCGYTWCESADQPVAGQERSDFL